MEAPRAQPVVAPDSATRGGASATSSNISATTSAAKYRGATVEDLDPPSALSTSPYASISSALMAVYERDYTHLTVLDPKDKSLLGYISTPRLRRAVDEGTVREDDHVERAMVRFRRRGRRYRLITMDTPLYELEAFFAGSETGEPQDFAVVTDPARRFVLGVTTKSDLEEFVRRRPS